MDRNQLNERLRNIHSEKELRLLCYKRNRQLRGILHGTIVDKIKIIDDYAHYTYLNSNIIGYCKIQKLYQYVTF